MVSSEFLFLASGVLLAGFNVLNFAKSLIILVFKK